MTKTYAKAVKPTKVVPKSKSSNLNGKINCSHPIVFHRLKQHTSDISNTYANICLKRIKHTFSSQPQILPGGVGDDEPVKYEIQIPLKSCLWKVTLLMQHICPLDENYNKTLLVAAEAMMLSLKIRVLLCWFSSGHFWMYISFFISAFWLTHSTY